jgi:RNA polymerase sigma-70 factor (ECF subfamily)
VRNRSLNYLKTEFGNGLFDNNKDHDIMGVRDINDPHSILLLNELMGKISNIINEFPPQCQGVFMLRRIEGKKNREIADKMNISIKTVESHMKRAPSALRHSLNEYV